MTEWLLPLTFAMIAAGAVIWLLDLLERLEAWSYDTYKRISTTQPEVVGVV